MVRAPITRLLAAGSLFFAGWGLLRPGSLARRMGIDDSAGRQVGVREAIIGVVLLLHPGPVSLSARVLADIADTAETWRHDRRVAAFAMASAASATTLAAVATRRGTAP
jgi:hypothetical protein